MDVFRFMNPTNTLLMQQGQIINGLISKMWVERYADAGEFSFVADASSNLRKLLPIGSFVSHVDTSEIMIVENHEINDVAGQNSQIIITGRGFETFLENRIVGSNKEFPTTDGNGDYTLAAGYSYNQIVNLLNDHIYAADLIDVNNALYYTLVTTELSGAIGENIARTVKRDTVYQRVLDLLAIDNLGIRIFRPGPWSTLGPGSPNTAIDIHQGQDKRSSIIFSHDTGEITSADYLWSNKNLKNAALIFGRWVTTSVVPSAVAYGRRWMMVDASDIDQSYSTAPTGTSLTSVVSAMQQRGKAALSAQNDVALTKAEVSKNAANTKYRRDFNVGDLITVLGSYNETTTMRISEYVEIEDQTGESSYPTLTLI